MVPSVFANHGFPISETLENGCHVYSPYFWSDGAVRANPLFLPASHAPYLWSDGTCNPDKESFLGNGCPYHDPYLWSDGKCKFAKESFLKNMCPSTDPYRWSDNYCHALQESEGLENGCYNNSPYLWSDGTCNTLQESEVLENGCPVDYPYLLSDGKCSNIPELENPQNIQAMYLVSIIVVIGVIIGIVFAFRNKKRESSAVPSSPPVPSPPVPSPPVPSPPVSSSPVPSSPTSENVLKSEDLVDHKQTSDDQINKNCSLCKVSFPSSQAMLQHTIEKHSLVNIKWQVVFLFMPFVSIWAFYRIKKLGKGLLLALGLDSLFFGIIFLMLMVASVSNNENGILVSNVVFFIGVMFVWLGMIWLRIHYMLKWSRQWNKKRDIQIESLSNEPKQD